jgi:hypothetical protein
MVLHIDPIVTNNNRITTTARHTLLLTVTDAIPNPTVINGIFISTARHHSSLLSLHSRDITTGKINNPKASRSCFKRNGWDFITNKKIKTEVTESKALLTNNDVIIVIITTRNNRSFHICFSNTAE